MTSTKDILEKISYITLATADENGQPWNTPVFSVTDAKGNFYWGSYKDSQHSKNIHANNKVFLVIYDSTVPPGEGEGVYVKGHAEELTNKDEIAAIHEQLKIRHTVPYWRLEEMLPGQPICLYKVVPEKVWRNAEGEKDGIYIDVLKEEV